MRAESVLLPGMVRRHYDLPSLNALAAFEAAARHASLTRAAEELNVTPGAVSKQVKALEDEIGRPLFLRLHRALELTPEGHAVFQSLKDAFERVSGTIRQVGLRGSPRSVSIGTTMAFAQLWLMPRLGDFWTAHQDIVIDHVISDRTHELRRTDLDLRVRYGDGAWPEERSAPLFGDRIIAVASPEFLARHKVKTVQDLSGLPLLSVEGVDWTWTTWADFLRETGAPHRKLSVRRFNSYVIALQAAQAGQGVALGWVSLVKPLIARRLLVQASPVSITAPQSFYVTWPAGPPLKQEAEVLRDWLLSVND
ncbi:LysR substrate-binding domain-containing protein [Aestuariivirga sp.]|uniref:LysR substrate-binding domain-containing protein n=1 Tax=Aestuariivirga sp. TaxID=2650926 RepID=UPI003BAD0A84